MILKDLTINAMIPAREGSQRLQFKNLAILDGRPLVSYVLESAINSRVFSKVSLNSESTKFESLAKDYNVSFFKRELELGGSQIKSDDVVYDFMQKEKGDITVWVNPTSPLQTPEEIAAVVNYFVENKLDSLITVKSEQVHCNFDGSPLNYNFEDKFAQTQDLVPVDRFVYSIMMWNNSSFIENYEKKGEAMLSGKVGFYPVSKESSIIVKSKEDFDLIHAILLGKKELANKSIQYYKNSEL